MKHLPCGEASGCAVFDNGEDAERDLRRLGANFDCVDIDAEPDLQRLYDEHVPVLMLDGAELARAPLTEKTLRLAIDLSEAAP